MDKYVKVKRIGEGSFGKAYLVRDRASNRQYVIKEINISKMNTKEREEARKEVAVLAQLQHPNIVSYRESFEQDGNLYIVMDYCECGDLYGKINAQRGVLFTEDVILDWFVQICLSIKHIHDRKILHRDIKSQNIFVSKGGIMKLGDFGIAKVLNSTVELARTCIGTPYYLSPEICENRPYNNKSDIWSLGCVLYELTTLKHAFEAGNMKNLVLKIIRGTYPAVSSRYSYELRNLIGQLFKRNPRDRPSISAVLKKPFIQDRIRKFLSESEVQSEFCHTVLHGEKLQKRLLPGGKPPSAAPPPKRPVSAAPARYDPSSIYKNKVARRPASANARNQVVGARSNSGGAQAKAAAIRANNNDLAARRRELMEKERQRRADAAERRKQADVLQQHDKLVEKQKVDRINKQRDAWRDNLLDSYGEKKADDPSPREDYLPSEPVDPAPKGNYQRYHDYLDQRVKDRKQQRDRDLENVVPHRAAGRDYPPPAKQRPESADSYSAQNVIDPVAAAQRAAQVGMKQKQLGAHSAERARIVEEYKSRQREAMLNKARGQAAIHGTPAATPSSRPPSGRSRSPRGGGQQCGEENDYLQKLKQIRLQNFNDRRALKERQQVQDDPRNDAAARQKKIEALRAQADERAKQLKAQLEKNRQTRINRERQQWKQKQEQRAAPSARPSSAAGEGRAVPSSRPSSAGEGRAVPSSRPSSAETRPSNPSSRPSAAVGGRAVPIKAVAKVPGMTNVMEAIGLDVGKPQVPAAAAAGPSMTNVMSDIGSKEPEAQNKLDNNRPVSARGQWGAPAATPLVLPDRPKWGESRGQAVAPAVDLSNLKLESTGSQMEATSVAPDMKRSPAPARASGGDSRAQWSKPSGTVMNALQAARVVDGTTVTISSDQASEAVRLANQKIGATMNVDKPLVLKPTILPKPKPLTGATITISKDEPDAQSETDRPGTVKEEEVTTPTAETSSKTSTSPPKQAGDAWSVVKEEPASEPISQSPEPKEEPVPTFEVDSPRKESEESGRLFDKVDLQVTPVMSSDDLTVDDLENDLNEREQKLIRSLERTSKSFLKKTSGVMIGLTTGNFDCNHSMLRTCSEPDLSKLFKTVANPFMDIRASASVLDDSPDDDSDESASALTDSADTPDDDSHAPDDNDADDEDGDGEAKDLTDRYEAELAALIDSNGSSTMSGGTRTNESDGGAIQTPIDGKGDDSDVADDEEDTTDDSSDFEHQDVVDFENMRITLQQIVQGEDGHSAESIQKTMNRTINPSTLIGAGEGDLSDILAASAAVRSSKEEWVSDGNEDSDHGTIDEEGEDKFCRLEESRMNLEEELGETTFLKAYKIVQAIHEDEDENMEDGSKLVTKVLGDEKSHLYSKILHLVMADSAYLDDNDV